MSTTWNAITLFLEIDNAVGPGARIERLIREGRVVVVGRVPLPGFIPPGAVADPPSPATRDDTVYRLSRADVEAFAGRPISDAEAGRVARALAHSSLSDCISTVVDAVCEIPGGGGIEQAKAEHDLQSAVDGEVGMGEFPGEQMDDRFLPLDGS